MNRRARQSWLGTPRVAHGDNRLTMAERQGKDEIEELRSRLRQVDDLARKGLLPVAEAEQARQGLRKRLLQAVLPDRPAPRLPWRARLGALLAMLALVTALAVYLLSGEAGLRRQSMEAIDAARAARVQRLAAQDEGFARLRAEKESRAAASEAGPSKAEAPPASGNELSVGPLLAGHVEVAAALQGATQPTDAVFILVRTPDDPASLPLAALRRAAADLPFDFVLRSTDLVGDARRYRQAAQVVVTARVSRTGSGAARTGDLVGTTSPVVPGSAGVTVVIDRTLP
ncbi:MAG TPA: c-type cytochrome biogenesis protein CcmI [Burkholderiaceae bacterium]|nr:c-type cytochrome biogenesis protein CcmI [Burkholderiaceae bacterium]